MSGFCPESPREPAARQNRSIGSIIEESLKLRSIRTYDSTKDLVAKARANPNINANVAVMVENLWLRIFFQR